MKQRILNNWNVVRFIRLTIGIVAVIQGIAQREVMITLAGLFISSTAILNYGCCGSTGCAMFYPSKVKKEIKLKIEDSRDEI